MRPIGLSLLIAGAICLSSAGAHAQQFPMLDKMAQKVVQQYQTSSCQQLAAKRAQKASGQAAANPMEARIVRLLHEDAQARQEFIGRVAGPIANKMFECGMIP